MVERVHIPAEDIERCVYFSRRCAEGIYGREFGENNTPRSVAERSRDIMIGKLAEVAVAKYLKSLKDILIELDFNIYKLGIGDTADIIINGKIYEVKAARTGAKWLLVDTNQLISKKKLNRLPYAFIAAVTGWDRELDAPVNFVDLYGYAYLNEICNVDLLGTDEVCDWIPDTYYLAKGEYIPHTNCELQAANCARPFYALHDAWINLL